MARMTLKQAMQVEDLKGLTKKELREILAPIRDAANKRLNRLEKAGLTNAPAFQAAQETGGKIYGSQYNTPKDLRREIRRGQAIIKYKTSTISGTREYFRKMNGTVPPGISDYSPGLEEIPDYASLNSQQIGAYWKIMDKLAEQGMTALTTEMYNTMKALVRAAVNSEDPIGELMNRLPAGSHAAIEEAFARQGVSVDPESSLIDNALTAINAYLDWRIENGMFGLSDAEEEDEEEDWMFL